MSELAFKPRVTTIPATLNKFTAESLIGLKKRRVAAYARVSADEEEQLVSYENQVDYYTNFIQEHENWALVKVYTDEGITGTNTKHRAGFNAMIEGAFLIDDPGWHTDCSCIYLMPYRILDPPSMHILAIFSEPKISV